MVPVVVDSVVGDLAVGTVFVVGGGFGGGWSCCC